MKKNCIAKKSVQGFVLRHVSEEQAWQLVRSGHARWRDSNTVQMLTLERRSDTSSAALSVSETRAVSGEFGASKTAHLVEVKKLERDARGFDPEDFIECATEKVRLWPLIGDTKAVRVCPA